MLEDSVAESPSVSLLTEVGWGSSEDDFGAGSELAEVLSSQAFSVRAPAMPSVAAMALLAANEMDLIPEIFFFSIFIFYSCRYPRLCGTFLLNFYIRLLEGGDHAAHRSADAIGAEVYLATNVYGRASRKPIARVVDVPDGGLAGRRTCRIGGFA